MQTAQQWARTHLSRKFPEEFRKLYEEEKARLVKSQITFSNPRSRAQNRAKTILVSRYLAEYRALYAEAVKKGHPRSGKNYGFKQNGKVALVE